MKTHTSLISMVAILFSFFSAAAQELPEVISPSPTVSSLMNFEDVPIDYYTGQPDISIPIYSKRLNADIALGLSLRYSTLGIKVDDLSGWTGTGWALDAGGVISRTVRGGPDEENRSSPGSRLGVLHNPDFWNYQNLSIDDKAAFNWKALGTLADNYDSQLDLYQFSALGVSGRFVVVIDNGVLVPKLLSREQNIKIDIDYDDITFEIDSFTVTDANGYRYLFDQVEETVSSPVAGSEPQGGVGAISASGISGIVYSNSAWHLSEIRTPNHILLASFEYTTITSTYTASISRTYNRITSEVTPDLLANAYNTSVLKPQQTVTYFTTTVDTKKPSKITFKDGTSIDFALGTNHPETNGAILNDVIIKDHNDQENRRYAFSYSTVNSRLWLDKVSTQAGGETQDYELTYYNKNITPFDGESDDWGYTDGTGTNGAPFDVNAIKSGLLTKIEYPTGGSKVFEFEHNSFSYQGSDSLSTNDYFSYNPNNSEVVSENRVYNLDNNSGATNIVYDVDIAFDQEVTINNALDASNPNGLSRIMIILKNDSDFEYRQFLDKTGSTTLSLEVGNYSFEVIVVDPLTLDPYNASGTASLRYYQKKTTYAQEAIGGGVRIKSVTFKDSDDSIEKEVNYTYNDVNNPNRSSGAVDAKLGSITREYEVIANHFLFTTALNTQGSFFPMDISYDVKTKGTNAQLTRGGYVGYKSVSMSETNNGKTVMSYTTAQDFPSSQLAFIYPFFPVPNIDFKRGLLLKQDIYDNSNRILKSVENLKADYNFIEETIAPSLSVYDLQQCEWSQFYDRYIDYINLNPNGNTPDCGSLTFVHCVTYSNCGSGVTDKVAYTDNLTSSWVQLLKSTTKDYLYDTNGVQSVVVTRQEFEFNDVNFQQSVVHNYINEKGIEDHYKTETFYPVGLPYPSADYTSEQQSDIDSMVTLNKINMPVYTRSYKNEVLQSKTQNIFKTFNNDSNQIMLHKIRTATGVSGPLEERIVYHHYDSDGNIREVAKANGASTVYIWGYNATLPVAKIDNATYSQVLATGINESIINNYLMHSEAEKNTELNKIKTGLPNALTSIYSYDPVIGITSMTDPRDYSMTYQYDVFNRLEVVKDQDGKILSKNVYNYKN